MQSKESGVSSRCSALMNGKHHTGREHETQSKNRVPSFTFVGVLVPVPSDPGRLAFDPMSWLLEEDGVSAPEAVGTGTEG